MTACRECGRDVQTSKALNNLCSGCIEKSDPDLIIKLHQPSHKPFDLPVEVPESEGGVSCKLCGNTCVIAENDKGFCGLRENKDGKLHHLGGTRSRGMLQYYFDRLPTNCVASWVCPGSDAGGEKNLAVFYTACSFDCLYCQNWHFREIQHKGFPVSAQELADAVDDRTHCICYFGGDPSVQMPHALAASRIALGKKPVRICFETNGNMRPRFLELAVRLAFDSGGIIKFDLKAFSPGLHRAITGISNENTLANFRSVAGRFDERPEVPIAVASTLLVPGYVEAEEVGRIAEFVASIDSRIPYSLLAFHPDFRMNDLPVTSRRQAEECAVAATDAGLERVNLGNIHLLR
ncbi:MAG: radical SAM protein [Planctomycetota bacterium]|nr:MAG: radical SAM protein [Planctomycetota bacterium]